MREYGWRQRYVSESPGTNSRLDELQAAILRVKLRHLDRENDRRRRLAGLYCSLLSRSQLILPRAKPNVTHVYHQFVVRSTHRDGLRSFLTANSIGTLVHYPVPVHLQPAYKQRVLVGNGGLHNTEQLCREILSLPMHPQLSTEQVRRVCGLVEEWTNQRS
jgi:dTDP-4-amino-4,6-dideoxygalactose transaminase